MNMKVVSKLEDIAKNCRSTLPAQCVTKTSSALFWRLQRCNEVEVSAQRDHVITIFVLSRLAFASHLGE